MTLYGCTNDKAPSQQLSLLGKDMGSDVIASAEWTGQHEKAKNSDHHNGLAEKEQNHLQKLPKIQRNKEKYHPHFFPYLLQVLFYLRCHTCHVKELTGNHCMQLKIVKS